MKKLTFAGSLLCLSFAAHAQSSVTIYGLLDEGFTYVTNEGGSHGAALQDSIQYPSVFGLKGAEDLGGGTKAIFNLTSQFSVNTGALIIPSDEFNRTAMVGLSSSSYGTVTLGNQYSFMMDSLFFGGFDAAYTYGGLYNLRQGPFAKLGVPQNPTGQFEFDMVGAPASVPNSIKYVTPDFNGFTAGAMYGFGGVAGSFGEDRTMSYTVNYRHGDFAASAAYLDTRYAALDAGLDSIRNYGAGLKYKFYGVNYNLLFTDTRNTLTNAEIRVIQVGANRRFATAWLIGANYQYMKGNAQLANNKASQFTAAVQYWLSKRTDIYVEGVFQQAGGDGPAFAWINGLTPSSSSRQTAMRIGLATQF